jgi:uncharacterized protein (DUF2062 family)
MWLKMWLKKRHETYQHLRESLKDSRLYGIFGDKLFHHQLWRNDKRAIAGGLSLGLFVAFTPTIPFQMILVTGGALMFKVNLPIALAACWITNPLTILPVYMSAWKLGKYVVEHFILVEEVLRFYPLRSRPGRFIQQTISLWIGSLMIATASALSANIMVRLLWRFVSKIVTTRARTSSTSQRKTST